MNLKELELSQCKYIRRFSADDNVPMLELMHDGEVNQFFRFNGNEKTIDDVTNYIKEANESKDSLHLAMQNEGGKYIGSISLKNIDHTHNTAEYAIMCAKQYHGKGYAYKATKELLSLAFGPLQLHSVFLDVYSENTRAIRFYEKIGFVYEGEFKECLFIRGQYRSLKWYRILENTTKDMKESYKW